ncbi:GNAT family N-acetyltransferase [Sulfolobus sp. S-194]|uniref:GNAT family N-acetyltransferase n=1 Tax=Sulfolobus sp. S-194 TaxID=2512240 RepID=UPI0014370228|nr:GNAT family N-acetyltransferase [Sulfolobus sp. S-194]QIW25013.1 GNAT family N-acetyltransferase [Sulfolobus sp. S-194]
MLIDGKKIDIIRAREEHAENFFEYLQSLRDDPDNYTIIRYEDVKLENIKKIKWDDNPLFLAVEEKKVVGSVQLIRGKYFGLNKQPHVAEIAYSVAKEFRGKGLIYALIFKALEEMRGIKIITAWVDERNLRSQRLLEKLGAKMLGKINYFIYSLREGIYVNMMFYLGDREEMMRRAKEEANKKGVKEY